LSARDDIRRRNPSRSKPFSEWQGLCDGQKQGYEQSTISKKEEQTMNKTLTTLAAGALALALIVPAYAGTSSPASSPTSSPTPSVTQTKAPVGKTTLKKGKHGKKGTQKKQNSATAPAPASATH
jgi:hypothetical protein